MMRVEARLLLLAALSTVSACSQLLGIEDAHVDESLDRSAQGTSGQATTGGTSTASPSPTDAGTATDHSGHSGGSLSNTGGASGDAGKQPIETGEGGAPPEPTLCERYCDTITANCTGKYEQYRTFDQCVEVCKRLPPGKPGDDDINTVECRVRQAEFADSEPFVYCKSAGPLGAGRCGSTCTSYCSIMQVACTPESTAGNLELSYFASPQECLETCNALPPDETGPTQYSSSATAEPTSFVGNNIYCRTYHLAAALEQDTPDEHCPHAMGGDPCIAQ